MIHFELTRLLKQGYTLVAETEDGGQPYPASAPSLLGQPYMAAWGQRKVIIGASKSYGWTAEQVWGMGRPAGPSTKSGRPGSRSPCVR